MYQEQVDIAIFAIDLVYAIQDVLVCLLHAAGGKQDLGGEKDV